ncbi:Zn(II)2Cys6 transcription factor domain-containing protein [Aspergillus chevalieri]|uniref:Zn(2)-C6 fungal-type domain-containing protein n=1 Tax=Aspergillus chevalieri TaxID=182096 RepID=A0A7R7VRG8_ASPCH|nr:uncharacterized protein ACHE_50560A [Aspergillus chevalieri]BCR89362.1 hypothetical protein ACHE_50560A [Aspergillus chevalieri]
MSPREVGQRPEPRRNLVSPHRAPARETYRSRKGCPECRRRKIKCDETRPECGQCLKSGRACHIIDGLFKQHSYTFLATSHVRAGSRQKNRSSGAAQGAVSHENADGDTRREIPEPSRILPSSLLFITTRLTLFLSRSYR